MFIKTQWQANSIDCFDSCF